MDSNTPTMGATEFRIPPQAFTASIFTFLAIAIVATTIRIYLRFKAFRKLHTDDYFMIAAALFLAASTGVTQASRDLIYLQMSVDVGDTIPDDSFPEQIVLFDKLDTAEYMLQWSCIYCVKLSYIFFFRNLTSRLRPLQIWWWILVAIVIPTALATISLAPWVCPHYDLSLLAYCAANGSAILHERIILDVSTATDIATDILVISIPIWLLTTVKLELKRKLALGAVLCLSIFMIIIAIIRYSLVNIPQRGGGSIPDTIWLFFWQSIESVVAIIMVSLTAFRSLYGQERAKYRNARSRYGYVSEPSTPKKFSRHFVVDLTSSRGSKNKSMDEDEEELKTMEKPQAALIIESSTDSDVHYQTTSDFYPGRTAEEHV